MKAPERRKLTEMIEELRERKQLAKDVAEDVKALEAQIIQVLAEHEQDSFETKDANGKKVRAKVVQGSHDVLDELRFKKKIGTQMWNKVTTRTVDKQKLKAYIASNEIKASTVAECSTYIEHKPYVKVT